MRWVEVGSLKFARRLAPTRPVGGIPGLQNKIEPLIFKSAFQKKKC